MAVCTNKQEYLSNDLLKKIGIYEYFEYVAGSDTFNYCKPDPRHLTSVVEILDGDLKKTIIHMKKTSGHLPDVTFDVSRADVIEGR